ncbi:MAG: STAS domain-containing protein [Pseudomonadota bacterium]|uniref:STAS domain-containing protein n=1 Tax=Polaromonas sp. YR568 TaxID=1855301 RepID=UPI0031383A9F
MLTLPPVLTHAVAAGFARGLKPELFAVATAEVVADAGALQQFDSSALAVLLECRRHALAAGKRFSVRGAPARLRELAELYGVAELIPSAATSST